MVREETDRGAVQFAMKKSPNEFGSVFGSGE